VTFLEKLFAVLLSLLVVAAFVLIGCEKKPAPRNLPRPGGNATARTGARTGARARAGTDASSGTCEAREEVIACGNDQLEILSRPPDGAFLWREQGLVKHRMQRAPWIQHHLPPRIGRRPQAGSPREAVISSMLGFPLCPRGEQYVLLFSLYVIMNRLTTEMLSDILIRAGKIGPEQAKEIKLKQDVQRMKILKARVTISGQGASRGRGVRHRGRGEP